MPTRNPNVVDYTSGTIPSTGDAVTIFGMGSALVTSKTGLMKCFVGVLETVSIRARGDGEAGSASVGQLIGVGDVIYMTESELEKTTFINDSAGTSGFIRGHFYDVEVPNLIGKE